MHITPNRRMASFLQRRNHKPCFSLIDWLFKLYEKYQLTFKGPILITETEELLWWEKAIANSEFTSTKQRLQTAAQLCQEARTESHHWILDPSLVSSFEFPTLEVKQYQKWHEDYEKLLQEKNRIDLVSAIQLLITAISKDIIKSLPKSLTLVGFEEQTPLMGVFFKTLASKGISIQTDSLISQTGTLSRITLNSPEEEVMMAAYQARQWLKEKPGASIGIVIPDIKEKNWNVEAVFQNIVPDQFTVSVPLPLSQYPIISEALLILKGQISFVKEKEKEKEKENKTPPEWKEVFLRILTEKEWPGPRLPTSSELKLIGRFHELLDFFTNLTPLYSDLNYEEAIQLFINLSEKNLYLPEPEKKAPICILGVLEALGLPFDYLWVMGLHQAVWPSDPKPNPLIPLALQKQFELPKSSSIRELTVAKRLTERLCQGGSQVIFSVPHSIDGTPVQISSLLKEIPEVTTETLKLNQESKSFIQNYQINPIPINTHEMAPPLQDKKVKGGARILALQAQCPFLAFAEQRLKAKPIKEANLGLDPLERGEVVHHVLEEFWKGLSGSQDLKAMEAKIREQKVMQAIKKVLQKWKEKKEFLDTQSISSCDKAPVKASSGAYKLVCEQRAEPATKSQLERRRVERKELLQLEQNRLKGIILQYLDLEALRTEFTILGHEQEKTITLGDLQFSLRLDRIDELPSGEKIIIDYKTGNPSLSEWFTERPLEPQLPLYALINPEATHGIVLAIINAKKIEFKGVSQSENTLPGVKELQSFKRYGSQANWADQIDLWHKVFTQLANEYKTGVARILPRDGQKTCRNCDLKSLCRVNSTI